MVRQSPFVLRYRTAWRELLHPLPVWARKMEWLKRDCVEQNEAILRQPYYTLKSYALPPAVGQHDVTAARRRDNSYTRDTVSEVMRQPRHMTSPAKVEALREGLQFPGAVGPSPLLPRVKGAAVESYAEAYGARLRPRYPESWDTVPPHQPSRNILEGKRELMTLSLRDVMSRPFEEDNMLQLLSEYHKYCIGQLDDRSDVSFDEEDIKNNVNNNNNNNNSCYDYECYGLSNLNVNFFNVRTLSRVQFPRTWIVPPGTIPPSCYADTAAHQKKKRVSFVDYSESRCIVNLRSELLKPVKEGNPPQKVLAVWPDEERRTSFGLANNRAQDHHHHRHSGICDEGSKNSVLYWPAYVKRVVGVFDNPLFDGSPESHVKLQAYSEFKDILVQALQAPMSICLDVVFCIDEISEARRLTVTPAVCFSRNASTADDIEIIQASSQACAMMKSSSNQNMTLRSEAECPLLIPDSIPQVVSIRNYSYTTVAGKERRAKCALRNIAHCTNGFSLLDSTAQETESANTEMFLSSRPSTSTSASTSSHANIANSLLASANVSFTRRGSNGIALDGVRKTGFAHAFSQENSSHNTSRLLKPEVNNSTTTINTADISGVESTITSLPVSRKKLNHNTLSHGPISLLDMLAGPICQTRQFVFLRPTAQLALAAQRKAIDEIHDLWQRLRQAVFTPIYPKEIMLPSSYRAAEVMSQKTLPLQMQNVKKYIPPYIMEDRSKMEHHILPPPPLLADAETGMRLQLPILQGHCVGSRGSWSVLRHKMMTPPTILPECERSFLVSSKRHHQDEKKTARIELPPSILRTHDSGSDLARTLFASNSHSSPVLCNGGDEAGPVGGPSRARCQVFSVNTSSIPLNSPCCSTFFSNNSTPASSPSPCAEQKTAYSAFAAAAAFSNRGGGGGGSSSSIIGVNVRQRRSSKVPINAVSSQQSLIDKKINEKFLKMPMSEDGMETKTTTTNTTTTTTTTIKGRRLLTIGKAEVYKRLHEGKNLETTFVNDGNSSIVTEHEFLESVELNTEEEKQSHQTVTYADDELFSEQARDEEKVNEDTKETQSQELLLQGITNGTKQLSNSLRGGVMESNGAAVEVTPILSNTCNFGLQKQQEIVKEQTNDSSLHEEPVICPISAEERLNLPVEQAKHEEMTNLCNKSDVGMSHRRVTLSEQNEKNEKATSCVLSEPVAKAAKKKPIKPSLQMSEEKNLGSPFLRLTCQSHSSFVSTSLSSGCNNNNNNKFVGEVSHNNRFGSRKHHTHSKRCTSSCSNNKGAAVAGSRSLSVCTTERSRYALTSWRDACGVEVNMDDALLLEVISGKEDEEKSQQLRQRSQSFLMHNDDDCGNKGDLSSAAALHDSEAKVIHSREAFRFSSDVDGSQPEVSAGRTECSVPKISGFYFSSSKERVSFDRVGSNKGSDCKNNKNHDCDDNVTLISQSVSVEVGEEDERTEPLWTSRTRRP